MRPRLRMGLRFAMVLSASVAIVAAGLSIGVRSTYGGHAAVDEPQYLLTALSLWEDRSLDISDELAEQRWRAFHDAELPVQTEIRSDGRALSPHDPLLPLLLMLPMGVGGWLAAKLTLTLIAGACAALAVWIAVRRLQVPPSIAAAGVCLAFASPPLAIYGGQVYPELPAAGFVLVAVAALSGRLSRSALVLGAAAVIALPWLSVKYVPVAAALVLVVLWRLVRAGRKASALWTSIALAGAGAVYLGVHRLIWGGWTVYASGDHFVSTGEFSVVGVSPDYVGRSLRLVGLFFDRGYGLVPWQAAWLLVVPAAVALVRLRPRTTGFLLLPAALGWATATWVAFTMRGFWWPGRQLVVVLPLLLLGVLWWLAHVVGPRVRFAATVLAGTGVLGYSALLVDGWAGQLTWVTGFQGVESPLYSLLRGGWPDYGTSDAGFWWRHLLATTVLLALAAGGWRSAKRRASDSSRPTAELSTSELSTSELATPEQPAGARPLTSV